MASADQLLPTGQPAAHIGISRPELFPSRMLIKASFVPNMLIGVIKSRVLLRECFGFRAHWLPTDVCTVSVRMPLEWQGICVSEIQPLVILESLLFARRGIESQ